MATLAAIGQIPDGALDGVVFLGELSLAGALRPIRGLLAHLMGAKALGFRRAIVPSDNGHEASVARGIAVSLAENLEHLRQHLSGGRALAPTRAFAVSSCCFAGDRFGRCARAVRRAAGARDCGRGGPQHALRGAARGGKTMLARRLPTILPPLRFDEALAVTTIHSVAGLLAHGRGLVASRPFRSPHHTVSDAGLVGGGEPPRPGEISLAHHGVLFLDEVLEFRRSALEALRQPLEDGDVTIARARSRATFPARPLIVAAANPCPCGYAGDPSGRCSCSDERVRAYRRRLSGPLLDRIDLHVSLPPVDVARCRRAAPSESSESVRAAGRSRAPSYSWASSARRDLRAAINAQLSAQDVERRRARPTTPGCASLARAVERLGLSARAYGKVLRVARTIADLEGTTAVRAPHVAEAVQLRMFDRQPGIRPTISAPFPSFEHCPTNRKEDIHVRPLQRSSAPSEPSWPASKSNSAKEPS